MKKRIPVLAMFMVCAILLCEINLSAAYNSYNLLSEILSDMGQSHSQTQDQSLTSIADDAYIEFCTPELISGHIYNSLFNIRPLTRGKRSQGSFIRILLLFAVILCLPGISIRHLKYGIYLPKKTDAASVILFYIHNKDGKK